MVSGSDMCLLMYAHTNGDGDNEQAGDISSSPMDLGGGGPHRNFSQPYVSDMTGRAGQIFYDHRGGGWIPGSFGDFVSSLVREEYVKPLDLSQASFTQGALKLFVTPP